MKLRVSRKKLDELFEKTDFEGKNGAERFFQQVMKTAGVIITYPFALSNDLKCRRDPQIKIVGQREAVEQAKELILEELDTYKGKVTLKLDISFSDHGHVIGRGGRQIQNVMDQTNTHIHFPDGNRNSQLEKSNQVSIAGTPAGVKEAREEVRKLLPFSVSFEAPFTCSETSIFDQTHPLMQHVLKSFNVQVNLKISNGEAFQENIIVTVQGTRANYSALKEAVRTLYSHLVGPNMQSGTFKTHIEIAVPNQSFVQGRNGANIKQISQSTSTFIVFPEQNQEKESRKTTVTISGRGVDSVFLSWQHLLGYLPLALVFDLSEEAVDGNKMQQLMEEQGVQIMVRPKQRTTGRSVLVKAAEKDWYRLFQTRKEILDLETTEIPDDALMLPIPREIPNNIDVNSIPAPIMEACLKTIYEKIVNKGSLDIKTLPFNPAVREPLINTIANITPTNPILANDCLPSPAKKLAADSGKYGSPRGIPHTDSPINDVFVDDGELTHKSITSAPSKPASSVSRLSFSNETISQRRLSCALDFEDISVERCHDFWNKNPNVQNSPLNPEACDFVPSQLDRIKPISRVSPTMKPHFKALIRPNEGKPKLSVFDTLEDLLVDNHLENFIAVFQKLNINFETFLLLKNNDLIEIGIPFVSRRKMLRLIHFYQSSTDEGQF